ncbi:uncharacterized protein PRCAT00000412001 [Priceomyces carsonii]|uniref:uncharacterized protein n=1 Tax=Priceomyces carsonii TaxID=28549 RepID=UPI002EDB30C8|nr:unnamed protein product [Priceomyces carsonii]
MKLQNVVIVIAIITQNLAQGSPVTTELTNMVNNDVRPTSEILPLDNIILELQSNDYSIKLISEITSLAASEKVVNLDQPQFSFAKFEVPRRDSLTFEQLEYVIKKNPRSMILFKDTRTVLVPDDPDLFKENEANLRTKYSQSNNITYSEYDVSEKVVVHFENDLIPASSCLGFSSNTGSGSVSISYLVGLGLTDAGSGEVDYTYSTVNDTLTSVLSYSLGIQASKSVSFSGTYACNTEKGKDVRLFYRPGTLDCEPKKRVFFIDKLKKVIIKEEWENMGHFKLLTDTNPIYYCATEDKMDLRCDEQSGELWGSYRTTFKPHLLS